MTSAKDLGEALAPNGRGICGRRIARMKRERRSPAWLLRDLPALAGVFTCFWLFVIPSISKGFSIIRGGKPDQRRFDALADPRLAAEASLTYAPWREAYRRLGCNPKLAKLELAAPQQSRPHGPHPPIRGPGAEPLKRSSPLHRQPASSLGWRRPPCLFGLWEGDCGRDPDAPPCFCEPHGAWGSAAIPIRLLKL